jgi:hypothetical protein
MWVASQANLEKAQASALQARADYERTAGLAKEGVLKTCIAGPEACSIQDRRSPTVASRQVNFRVIGHAHLGSSSDYEMKCSRA